MKVITRKIKIPEGVIVSPIENGVELDYSGVFKLPLKFLFKLGILPNSRNRVHIFYLPNPNIQTRFSLVLEKVNCA